MRTVTADEAREEGLAELDEEYPQKRRAADEEILTLLGLLPEESDVRELAGTIFGEEVAGFYDDHTKEMTLVEGASGGTAGEITLAHELTHALEDQHFDLDRGVGPRRRADRAHRARRGNRDGRNARLRRPLPDGRLRRARRLPRPARADGPARAARATCRRTCSTRCSSRTRPARGSSTRSGHGGRRTRAARRGPGLDRADPASGEVPRGRAAAAGRAASATPGPGWKRARTGRSGSSTPPS